MGSVLAAPAQITGNVVWTDNGQRWSVFRLAAADGRWATDAQRQRAQADMAALLGSIPAEAMVWSTCSPDDIDAVVDAVTAGGAHGDDAFGRERWLTYALETVRNQPDAVLGWNRTVWLAIKHTPSSDAAVSVSALWRGVVAATPLRHAPSTKNVTTAQTESAALFAGLSRRVAIRPATTNEVVWLCSAPWQRGLPTATPAPTMSAPTDVGADVVAVRPFGDPVVTEGGTVAPEPALRLGRRFVEVETTNGTGYQSTLIVEALPAAWHAIDGGGDWAARLDQFDFPIEWWVRITPVQNRDATETARRQCLDLADQIEQWQAHGAVPDIVHAAHGVATDEYARLGADTQLCELHVSIGITIAADTLPTLDDRVDQVRKHLIDIGYRVEPIAGYQTELAAAATPGPNPAATICEAYTDIVFPAGLASAELAATSRLGDPTGALLGTRTDLASQRRVLFDPAYGPAQPNPLPATVAWCGASGSGKSMAMKTAAFGAVGRGHGVIVIDRSDIGEYATAATVMPGSHQIVQLGAADTTTSIDPLAVMANDGDRAHQAAVSVLSMLCDVNPRGPIAAHLTAAVSAVQTTRREPRLADVTNELRTMTSHHPGIGDVVAQLDALATGPLAGSLFDRHRPPMTLDADYTVLATDHLTLPDRDAVDSDIPLTAAQAISQALLYCAVEAIRHLMFTSTRFTLLICDEVWWLLPTTQGRALLNATLRDSRKHNAGIWLATQSVADIDTDIAQYIKTRFVFTHDTDYATLAADFVGLANNPDVAAAIAGIDHPLATGEVFLRDINAHTARVQLAPPAMDHIFHAFDTTPTTTPVFT